MGKESNPEILTPREQSLYLLLLEYGFRVFDDPEFGEPAIKILEGLREVVGDPNNSPDKRHEARERLRKLVGALETTPPISGKSLSLADVRNLPNEHRETYKICEEICERRDHEERATLLQERFPYLRKSKVENPEDGIACHTKPGSMTIEILVEKHGCGTTVINTALAESRKEEKEVFHSKPYSKFTCPSCGYASPEMTDPPTKCPKCKAPSRIRL